MKHSLICGALICVFNFSGIELLYGQVIPIAEGHSHNDYLRERPLTDALNNGMSSIEIDIILVNDQIIVAHDTEKYELENTIDKMYFSPLQKMIKKKGGALYSGKNKTVQLLIDLKIEGTEILDELHEIVDNYDLLFKKRDLSKKFSPLQIVLSGEVDKDKIIGTNNYPYFHVDGRCSDLKKKYPAHEVPLISENYTDHFKWNGEGKLRKCQVKKLKKIVSKIHTQGKKVRFWATDDNEKLWSHLLDHGVDYINVDDLKKFNIYMSTR